MKILGIETSCDETAAAVVEAGQDGIKVLSNVVVSQIDIHKKYGGVVPEVAAREHVASMVPVVHEALLQAGVERTRAADELDCIAVTVGPGLITSLGIGVETAKVLLYAWEIPAVAVNHVEGHIYANFIGREGDEIDFPAVILTVSGGHTMLALMRGHLDFETIGDTLDDAAGEAFDKAAKIMGIGYPGGPAVSAEAEKFLISNYEYLNNEKSPLPPFIERGHTSPPPPFAERGRIKLPRPMLNKPGFDFSFSGLKTAIRYAIEKDEGWRKRVPEYAYEFQEAVVDVLVGKAIKACREYGAKTLMLAGGVSANKRLRERLAAAVRREIPGTYLSIPDFKYTTDNAAMIAAAGYFKARSKHYTLWNELSADCGLEL